MNQNIKNQDDGRVTDLAKYKDGTCGKCINQHPYNSIKITLDEYERLFLENRHRLKPADEIPSQMLEHYREVEPVTVN